MNNIILSICIPSYNRISFLEESLLDILSCNDERFEIVVNDNNSNDSDSCLRDIKDHRFHLYKENENIGFSNVTKVLTLGTGKYSLLLLDKDRLNVEYLSKLIDILSAADVSCGYVSLSSAKSKPITVQSYKMGLESLNKTAYLSKHPSGYFFETKLFKESKVVADIISSKDGFGFPFELINAGLSLLKDTMFVDIPILTLESLDVCKKVKTSCFSGKNVYFTPDGRKQQFLKYNDSLSSVDLSNKQKSIVLNRIYYFYLHSSTIGYQLSMKNPIVLSHHNLEGRNISVGELLRYSFSAMPVYWKSTKWLGLYYRLKVLVLSQSRCLLSIIKNGIFTK